MVIGFSSEEMDAVINGGQLLRGLTPEIICFLVMNTVTLLIAIAIQKNYLVTHGYKTGLNLFSHICFLKHSLILCCLRPFFDLQNIHKVLPW